MKIHCHDDADGVTAAYFASFTYNPEKILVKTEFGSVDEWTDGDVMVDMRPADPNIIGIVYDHHPNHPEQRKYKLVWDVVPASLIVYKRFIDEIPVQVRWKLAIGLGGDNSLNLMPPELYKQEPQLLYKIKTYSAMSYGSMHISYYPVYKLLSSYVNSLLRIRKHKEALELLAFSQRPLDIINHPEANEAREKVREEVKRIMTNCELFNLKDIHVIIFESDYKLTGYLATVLEASKDIAGSTAIAINRKDGSMSVRGDLADYIQMLVKDLPYVQIDGHAGFKGGKLNVNPHIFIDELSKRL